MTALEVSCADMNGRCLLDEVEVKKECRLKTGVYEVYVVYVWVFRYVREKRMENKKKKRKERE